MHIIVFFALYHQTIKAVAPKNELGRLDPPGTNVFFLGNGLDPRGLTPLR